MIKSIAAAAMLAIATPAFAGGVVVAEKDDSKLKFESLFYLNTFQKVDDRVTSGVSSKSKTTGLNVDRAYFTARYYFDKNWMMRFTVDVGHESGLKKKQNVYLKYAYAEGKLVGKQVVLRVGQSHTPWIDYEQGKWKHRYVAKVMSDTYKFDTSADLGLGLKGKLADGLLDYFVTATNGTGYAGGNPSTGLNGIDFSGRVGLHPIEGLDIDFQFADGYKATKTHIANVKTAGVKSTLIQGMVSYGTDVFRVGGNYIYNKDKARSATASTAHGGNASSNFKTAAIGDEVKSSGWDVWAWVKIPGTPIGAFGRYENLHNKMVSGGVANPVKEKITRFVAGLEYSPIKNVTFAAVIDATKLKNRGGNILVQDKDTRFGLYS
ncbi:MAG: hypothetical protein ACE5E3_02565, partial [Mariprofundus sp.]